VNISELEKLAEWFLGQYPNVHGLYQNLMQPIQYNSSQPTKQPLENHLNELVGYLKSMRFDELSLQQMKLLNDLGALAYLGPEGAQFVDTVVKRSDYDPATAFQQLSQAAHLLTEANSGFEAYRASLSLLGLEKSVPSDEAEYITIRIGFHSDAAINNVTDWKESARDWYDIIRGISLAVNESPEDTKILGASTGSIILILAGTLSVTTILALISKNVASVARDVISIRNQIEELRNKKLLNDVIEKELKKQEQKKTLEAHAEIIEIISKKIDDLDGEKKNALDASIKKLLAFNEKGGNVDFVAPDSPEDDAADADPESVLPPNALAEARQAIHSYQEVREQIKLLTDATG